MKVSIASSGLGHVARGIETWTRDTAASLVGSDLEVTLFSGAPCRTLHAGCASETLTCLKRNSTTASLLAKLMPGFTWRWGWKRAVGWEQYTFWRKLRLELRNGDFDILHTQEALLAKLCNDDAKSGYWNGRVILAHGTEEPPEFLEQFKYVQHLTPWHLSQMKEYLAQRTTEKERTDFAIPNFVDTDAFTPSGLRFATSLPVEDEPVAQRAAQVSGFRAELGIPGDALVIGCVAAVKKGHKRIDYLIKEFSAIRVDPCSSVVPFLLIAGAKTNESDELVAMAEELAPGKVKFLFDLPREQMPDVYRSMDIFVLTSLFEMMPIAVLEALATGLPCVVNKHPNLEWMIGDGGHSVDMSKEGALLGCMRKMLLQEGREGFARKARARAEAAFARASVVPRIRKMYEQVLRA